MNLRRLATIAGRLPPALALTVTLAGCDVTDDRFQYAWDTRRIVCSRSADDLTANIPWSTIEDQITTARDLESATLLHVHAPGINVSVERLAAIFDLADDLALAYITFPDLTPGAARAGIALSFDDDAVDEWFAVREMLRSRGVRATFFVTHYYRLTEDHRAKLAMLAADGHAIEAHAVEHLDAAVFIAEHGLTAYLEQEALPSITVLRDAGYTPTAFAYPFGVSDEAANDALLAHVERLRVGPRSCPY
ncbi:MAG: polysaccharide deacetylase family protein [Kofleriaceae bacterium]